MRYDAIYLYVDVNHVDYGKFTLPLMPLLIQQARTM